KAKDLIISTPILSENNTASEAISKMSDSKNLYLPLLGSNGLPSIISLAHIKQIPKALWETTHLKDIVIQMPKIIDSKDPLDEVLVLALSTPSGVVPISEEGRIIGILKLS